MAPVLELRSVSKHFGHLRAVEALTLSVETGTFFSLLGPSGSGKTTVLRLVAGFESPSSGELWLGGERLNGQPPYRRNVSTVFQNYALFPHLSVKENIAFGIRVRNGGLRERGMRRVTELMELLGLAEKAARRPHQLSGGERQRVALARSLALEPKLLLLDEPLSALDPSLRAQVRGELKALQRRVGITFVMVTHDCEEALSLSDEIALMQGGSLVQVGAPEALYRTPVSRFAAEFMGPVGWVDGIGLRPERARLAATCAVAPLRSVEGTVHDATYLGSAVRVELRSPAGARLWADLPSEQRPQVGERAFIVWHPDDELRGTSGVPLVRGAEPDHPAGGGTSGVPLVRGAEPDHPAGGGTSGVPLVRGAEPDHPAGGGTSGVPLVRGAEPDHPAGGGTSGVPLVRGAEPDHPAGGGTSGVPLVRGAEPDHPAGGGTSGVPLVRGAG